MTWSEADFDREASAVLDAFAEAIDDAIGDHVDVDMQGGILTLGIPGGGQYVLNKHRPNREIWLSSPVSGAFHFTHVDGKWISTRDKDIDLHRLLAAELTKRFGVVPEI